MFIRKTNLIRTLVAWGAVVVGYNVYNLKHVRERQAQEKIELEKFNQEWAQMGGK